MANIDTRTCSADADGRGSLSLRAAPPSPLRGSPLQGLLCNAEPFGFGPTAAIADFFPHLRPRFGKMGYIGAGHTLDLQTKLPYDTIHDITGAHEGIVAQGLRELRQHYDILLTALDFEMAKRALTAGFRVVVYDPLTWYWRELPPVVNDCLYVAQDFYGVRERCRAVHAPQVVPPIVDANDRYDGEREHVLLNLGGLSNPYWSAADTLAYARIMVNAFAACTKGKSTVIAGNAAMAREFGHLGARNYSRAQMQEVLRKAKYAFMTPGLGNIYDAARFGTPTVWLPPANDSQGQQRNLLQTHGRLDGAIDWRDFVTGAHMDYSGEQEPLLRQISAAVHTAAGNEDCQARFAALLARLSDEMASIATGKCSALLDDFGSGGALRVAQLVLGLAQEGQYANV